MRHPISLLLCLMLLAFLGACQTTKPHLSPAEGSIDGGDTVVIRGVAPSSGAKINRVEFAGKDAGPVTFISKSEIQVSTPPGESVGKVDVVVIDSHGGRTILEKGFEYKPRQSNPTGTGGAR